MKMQKRNKLGESSPFGAIIAAVCIIIYLAALIQGAVRLYLSVDQRKILAEQEFAYIANLALNAGIQGFMSEHFVETMNNSLASSKSIEALIISGPEGEYAFERQKGRTVTWVNNSPRFINRFSNSGQSLYLPLPIHDLRNVNIQAVAGAFDYAEFTKILKETLFLILIGFALAFFTMLLQLLLGKPGENIAAVPVVPVYTPISRERAGEPGPKGLYSPRSNIGWEQYTKDRLDSELHRCASTEKDLTLMAMEFTRAIEAAAFRQAAEEAVSFFTTRDLVFEYGKYGITVIIPGVDLENGFEKAQKFHQRIGGKFFNNNSETNTLCIGLSSRSGRLLNAGRMLLEVREALKKARNDRRASIVAFKSDPEKYREFIRKRG